MQTVSTSNEISTVIERTNLRCFVRASMKNIFVYEFWFGHEEWMTHPSEIERNKKNTLYTCIHNASHLKEKQSKTIEPNFCKTKFTQHFCLRREKNSKYIKASHRTSIFLSFIRANWFDWVAFDECYYIHRITVRVCGRKRMETHHIYIIQHSEQLNEKRKKSIVAKYTLLIVTYKSAIHKIMCNFTFTTA